MQNTHSITNLEELNFFAKELTTFLSTPSTEKSNATIVTLAGDLGAGKTTLAQSLGKQMGITEPMGSPTFVISKYYDLQNQAWKRLIHMDAYRLDGQNLDPLDLPTLFANPDNIILVEWPEYITSVLPKHITSISITHNSDDTRTINIKNFNTVVD